MSPRIAAIPMVAELRREHAIALVQPMVGCPWAGEPRVDAPTAAEGAPPTLPARWDWEIGAYATALLRKREPGFAAGDLSHLRTRFLPPATVLFLTDVRCRSSRRHPDGVKTLVVAELPLPAHVVVPRSCPPPPSDALPPALTRERRRLSSSAPFRPEESSRMTTDHPPSRPRDRAGPNRGGRP